MNDFDFFPESYGPEYATLEDWVLNESIRFSLDSPGIFNITVKRLIGSLSPAVELLGFGEALHGGEEILLLRNRLFQQLVQKHGYSAIAIESSFPRAHAVNEYVLGRGPASYDDIRETGFSHNFGRLDANRELAEWIRQYNTDPSHTTKVRFYGFDSPTEMTTSDSPRQLLQFVLEYLASVDETEDTDRSDRINALLGDDSAWENPAAMMDPEQSIGCSPAASALRIETEDLIMELTTRRPELVAKTGDYCYHEAVQYASVARQLLDYHALLAKKVAPGERIMNGLGWRDAMMADNLAYAVSCERGRGKVFAFAHNSHLQRGPARWQLGKHALTWWPAGAHLQEIIGPGYAVIGSAVGVCEGDGTEEPGDGTLEALLTAVPGPARFIPTYRGRGLPASEIAALRVRPGSKKNPGYFALTPQSFCDFDWLAVLDSAGYTRGGPDIP
ncbi:erythromycin esterase family protein [Methanoregula sp.]|uniref:erythromycin esterase family protein n=1 Tax=Methanoregula sp. TaxID=2052170 RepID=UPI003568E7DA